MFNTQKARGLYQLGNMVGAWPYWVEIERGFQVMPHQMPAYYDLPIFARPCPVTPRHGFVESREVKSLAELLDVFVQTRKADPQGEVITMRRLTGKASAVATEGAVTWARGNDGATGAKGQQWIIPCPAGAWTKRIHAMAYQLKGDIKGAAYAEIVEDNGRPFVVQLRDGPNIGTVAKNYIPTKDYLCVQTLTPKGEDYDDLLGWEAKMKAAPRGTVIIGLSGLSSHLAVQAICHGHAVWTDDLPTQTLVGQTLQPQTDQPAELKRRDYLYMRNFGKKRLHLDRRSAVPLAISTLHAMPYWGREAHLLRLRMAGAMTMLRLLTAACVGEDRHFYRVGPGSRGSSASKVEWTRLGYSLDFIKAGDASRDGVYDKVLPKSLGALITLLKACVEDFSTKGWNRSDHCGDRHCRSCGSMRDTSTKYSFGGPKWADCSRIALRLGEALEAFRLKPEKATWTAVVSAYNAGVLAAHNGGKCLDKFCGSEWVDACANAPQFGLIGRMAMEIVAETKTPSRTAMISKAKAKEKAKEQMANFNAFKLKQAMPIAKGWAPKATSDYGILTNPPDETAFNPDNVPSLNLDLGKYAETMSKISVGTNGIVIQQNDEIPF